MKKLKTNSMNTSMLKNKRILILGGLGFIGSNIANYFAGIGAIVTIIDGKIKGTGYSNKNVSNSKIKIIESRIEDFKELKKLIPDMDLIVDSMGWTSHLDALESPTKDIELNYRNHAVLIESLPQNYPGLIIYLSSIGVYGHPEKEPIVEKDSLLAHDVQGIDKIATESLLKLYCELKTFNCACLRFPNTYGKYQKTDGKDIGLVGNIIRTLHRNESLDIYKGTDRTRNILFIDDLVEAISRIFKNREKIKGFLPVNVSGNIIKINELAFLLKNLIGTGTIKEKPIPKKIARMDNNMVKLDKGNLLKLIGEHKLTDIRTSLIQTIKYFNNER